MKKFQKVGSCMVVLRLPEDHNPNQQVSCKEASVQRSVRLVLTWDGRGRLPFYHHHSRAHDDTMTEGQS